MICFAEKSSIDYIKVIFATIITLLFGLLLSAKADDTDAFEAAAARLRSVGVAARVQNDAWGASIHVSSADLGSCQYRLCRVLRRAARQIGAPVNVVLTIPDFQAKGWTYDRSNTMYFDVRGFQLHDLLDFQDPIFRHELQHVYLGKNAENHFLNGTFLFHQSSVADGYRKVGAFSAQEFFTFYDQNFRLPEYSDYRDFARVSDETVLAVAKLIGDWTRAQQANAVKTEERLDLFSRDEALVQKVLKEGAREGEAPIYVLTVKNNDLSIPERYKNLVISRETLDSYAFYSDRPYKEIQSQVAKATQALTQAARIWVDSIANTDAKNRQKLRHLKMLFKGKGGDFRFDCSLEFSTLGKK